MARSTNTDADIDAVKAVHAAIEAEFADPRVRVAGVRAAFVAACIEKIAYGSPKSPRAADNAHFNEHGHNTQAAAMLTTYASMPPVGPGVAFPHLRPVVKSQPTNATLPNGSEPGCSPAWDNAGGNLVEFTKTRAGQVTLHGTPKRTGTATNGDVLFTLPPGYPPASMWPFVGMGAGASTTGVAAFEVQPNGNVVWTAGQADLSTLCTISASFPADG